MSKQFCHGGKAVIYAGCKPTVEENNSKRLICRLQGKNHENEDSSDITQIKHQRKKLEGKTRTTQQSILNCGAISYDLKYT